MGWLVAQEQHLATVIYCIVLLPGIFIHEASHWVMAGILNVHTQRITAWPKADTEGRVDLSFIRIKEARNPISTILIGAAPFVVGFVLILWISANPLHLPDFIRAVNTGNVQVIALALQNLIGQPDFVLWFYLMFAISNTLWPEAEDRRGWLLIGGVIVGGTVLLAVIGFQNAVGRWFSGPIPQALNSLTTVFLIMLAIDAVVALVLFFLERSTERVTHRYAPYHSGLAVTTAKDNRAANMPRLASIMQYQLPLPPAPRKVERPAVSTGTASAPGLPRPATAPLAAGTNTGSGTRPAITPGSSPTAAPAFGMSSASPRPAAVLPATPAAASSSPSGSGFTSRPALPASTPSSAPGAGGGALTPFGSGSRPPPITSSGTSGLNTPRSSPFGAVSPNRTEDYIDAEVIEEDDEPARRNVSQPSSGSVSNKPNNAASDGPLYIDPEAPG